MIEEEITVLDLFAGIGGFTIAGELADAESNRWRQGNEDTGRRENGSRQEQRPGLGSRGFRTIAFSEIEPYACAVLAHRFPGIPNLGSVCDITRDSVLERTGRLPTVITGGFPCQPHSVAGLRKAGDDERDLWAECVRLLRVLRPRFGLFENVGGLLTSAGGSFLNRICTDLAEIRYSVLWQVVPASAVGAPHRRDRIWLICVDELAHRQREGLEGFGGNEPDRSEPGRQHPRQDGSTGAGGICADTLWPARPGCAQFAWEPPRVVAGRKIVDDTKERPVRIDGQDKRAPAGSGDSSDEPGDGSGAGKLGNAEDNHRRSRVGAAQAGIGENGKRRRGLAEPGCGKVEPHLGRNTLGLPTGLDATANRVQRLKALGNSIVPQVAAIMLRAIAMTIQQEESQ